MHAINPSMSPWRKSFTFDDPFVNLSNKKIPQTIFNQPKQLGMDRYIAQSLQKCLFKDKLGFNIQNSTDLDENKKSSAKKQKHSVYEQILQHSLKKHENRKLISTPSKHKNRSKALFSSKYVSKHMNPGYLLSSPQHDTMVPQVSKRSFPSLPYKILDAPKLKDDFYTSLLDWSSQDLISVVLDNSVYIWSAKGSQAQKLIEGYISCVKWGKGLLVGEETGRVRAIDVEKRKEIFRYKQHLARVGTIDVAPNGIVATGSKDSQVLVWDSRANAIAHRFQGHKQEICGLKWSADHSMLASGGNDNCVFVWQPKMNKYIGKLTQHTAAVKALAWSPHKNSLLATGGGSTDKTIKLWDTNQMISKKTIQTGSQVCNMVFSNATDQLISTHGYSLNSIVVWKTKTMQKLTTLHGHTFRVLYLAKSPDDQCILTGSGDQTLRFWKLFPSGKSQYENGGNLEMKNFMIR